MMLIFSNILTSKIPSRFLLGIFFLISLVACKKQASETALSFTAIPSSESHITFNNQITESDSVNFYTNEYMYIGSGVGVGDFNNDGFQDVFFAGSQVDSKLYLNKGTGFAFDDISEKAGIGHTTWCTGVSIVDINEDGKQDIYVCVSHEKTAEKRKNHLYINQGNNTEGIPTFKEQANEYGLADTSYSTQATFFDYDKDGDLDMYLLNHQLFNPQPNKLVPRDSSGNSPAADRLYRNEGINPTLKHPTFTDVSKEAGILEDGYGLGMVISDVNNDNYPDIYVANDYLSNDNLWINQQNGTFKNGIAKALKHQSYNSMGVDAADINNDLLPDFAVLDMAPNTNERKKMMAMGFSPEKFDIQQQLGYQPEYSRNMLQVHQGFRKNGEPVFSELGHLAGIAETDWSWSVLIADFDNDAWKDIHITNGLAKDLTNNDFLAFTHEAQQASYGFGGGSNSQNTFDTKRIQELRKRLDEFGAVKRPNFFFLNQHNTTFSDVSEAIGLAAPSVSHGAVYADLDNDGDLDLVVNNMNQEAFLYRNETREQDSDSTHNYLKINLIGTKSNPNGIGSKVRVFANGQAQCLEQYPVRGYTSSVDNRLHLGLGSAKTIDSLIVLWPNDKVQVLRNIKANQQIELNINNTKEYHTVAQKETTLFEEESTPSLFRHQEMPFFDYYVRRLQPQKYSQLGPCLAVADVNADGLEDFFVGGAARQSGQIFLQQASGNFIGHELNSINKMEEDLAATFLDVDNDHDLDLMLVGGSTEFVRGFRFPPRLYLNDGKGNFQLNVAAFDASLDIFSSTISPVDYDTDGDLDVFIGGRLSNEGFPVAPKSYLFQNNQGRFQDVTDRVCPSLRDAGMITAAVWTDINQDKKPDLILAGEWMPIRFFSNLGGKLQETTANTGLEHNSGMWRSLALADIDQDGDMDLVAGNVGWNNKYHVSPERPYWLFAKDMDKNGSKELIPAYTIQNSRGEFKLYPDLDRNQFAEQTPMIKKKYLAYQDFSEATMEQLIGDIGKEDLIQLSCETTSTAWFENRGKGVFAAHILPMQAQIAPVNSILTGDFDHDGKLDLIIAGNEYQTEVSTGRTDASLGVFLKGNGKGTFTPLSIRQTGLILEGDVKSLVVLKQAKGKRQVIAGINNQQIKRFTLQ